MASTSQIVDAFVTRLRGILPQLSVEHYAGAPASIGSNIRKARSC